MKQNLADILRPKSLEEFIGQKHSPQRYRREFTNLWRMHMIFDTQQKPCNICQKPFVGYIWSKYCSNECMSLARRRQRTKERVCVKCHSKFIGTPSAKFCSAKCKELLNDQQKLKALQLVRDGMLCSDVADIFDVSSTYMCKLIKLNGIVLSKYNIRLNDKQMSMIAGSLLGDAGCHRVPSGKCRLYFRHGPKQKQYLYWKYDILRNIVGSRPKHVVIPKSYSIESYVFSTLTNQNITDIANKLYVGNCKRITHNYLELIDDFALAVWMMDDGHMGKGGGSLSTHSFTYDENMIMSEWFAKRFNVKKPPITIDKRCNKPSLRLHAELNRRIHSTIKPHIPQCMAYKLRWLN
jgi:predicted nucleic acid-binding Zn ribbon protein